MSLTGYLKVPDIAGESLHAEHEEEMDVHSIEWEVSQGAAGQVGRGRSRARAEVGAVSVGKFFDAASPYLSLACMQAKSFDECVLSVRKDSGEAHLDYLVITMKNVVISSYQVLPTAENSLMIEERVSFTCEKITVKYTVQADDHSAGDEHEIEYDIAAGV